VARYEGDRVSPEVLARVARDRTSGAASGEVQGMPTLFIDGVVHRGGYEVSTLLEALAR
jgi:protein-disulfide isomerase